MKIKKKKKTKKDKQVGDFSEISNLMSEIRLLIHKDSLDIINIRNKMDELLLNLKSLIDKRQREALGKIYVLFNNALQIDPPMKKTLQSLFDVINIIICACSISPRINRTACQYGLVRCNYIISYLIPTPAVYKYSYPLS